MRERQPAICLGVTDYSETSQVVHFLTRGAGVARVLGKGTKRAKSKSGGAVDLFSEGELVFIPGRGESLGTLVEFSETVAHNALRKEASALLAALFMIEAAGRLLGAGDPHPEVFDLLHNSLARLGQADAPRPAVLAYFLWRLLRLVGLLGELRACVSCGQEFSVGRAMTVGTEGADGACAKTAYSAEAASAAKAGQANGKANGRAISAGVERRTSGEEATGVRPTHFSSSLGGLLCETCEGSAVEKYRLDGLALAALAALAAAEAGRRTALPANQAQSVIRLLAYHIGQQTGKPLRMARRYKAGS